MIMGELKIPNKIIYIILVTLVLVLSAIFRLGFPDVIEFKSDESAIAHEFFTLAKNNDLRFIGNTHGIYNIVIYDQLWWLLFKFFKDPRIITILSVGLLNTLGIVLTFLFGLKFFDKKIAFISSSLFGFSSWAILYSRKLWGVNLLQFLSVLAIFLLALSLQKNKPKLIFLPTILFFFAISLHLSVLLLLFIVILTFTIYNFKKYSKYSFLFMVFLILLSLLVLFRSNLSEFIYFVDICINSFSFKGLGATLTLMTRDKIYFEYLGIPSLFPEMDFIIAYFFRALFLLGLIVSIKEGIYRLRLRRFSPYFVMGIFYITYVTAFGFTGLADFYHYFTPLFPVYFIIMAIGFCSIINYFRGKTEIKPWEFLIIFMIWQPIITAVIIILIITLRSFNISKLLWPIIKRGLYYTNYAFFSLVLIFQVYSNFFIFKYLSATGGGGGVYELNLGAKIRAVKYIIEDAQKRYQETGLRSYYTVYAGRGYGFLFEYLMPKEKVIVRDEIDHGFHYIIAEDIKMSLVLAQSPGFLKKQYIGPVLVIVEKKQ